MTPTDYINRFASSKDELTACCGRLAKHIMPVTSSAIKEEMERDTPPHILFEAIINLHVSLLHSSVHRHYSEKDRETVIVTLLAMTAGKMTRMMED